MANNKVIDKANLELALSENNKKVKDYVDNKTHLSSDENNAIVTGSDNGLFVDDKTSELETLTGRVDEIKKYQKYLNTDLDSCYCNLDIDAISSDGMLYLPDIGECLPFKKVSGSMTVRDGKVVVKPGQRVQIDVTIGYYNNTSTTFPLVKYFIHNYTTGENIQMFFPQYRTAGNSLYGNFDLSITCQYTNNTDVECEIGIYVADNQTPSTPVSFHQSLTVMTVQEIGRQTIIDPIEHANEKYGIEDTPVGHIISHMGTIAPKHYLICDGTEYNIMDYPYLAQHFIDQFGSVNYFGGDGNTTFAVPDLRQRFLKGVVETENVGVNEEAGLPNITGIIGLHGADVATTIASASGAFYGSTLSKYRGGTNQSGATSLNHIGFRASNSNAIYGNSTTVTPANTSVLYCIKYEPTYYIQNYATKFQETTLWEGSALVDFGNTAGTISPNLEFNLADVINNYDRIQIKYAVYNTNIGLMFAETFKDIIVSDISIGDINADAIFGYSYSYKYSLIGAFTDEQTFKITTAYSEDNGSTSNTCVKIYQIIGLKPAKPVYDVAINCDNDYSTEERVIGRWVDGKPLYQKTIMTNIAITSATQNIEIPEDSSGWDIVMVDNSHSLLQSTTSYITLPRVYGTTETQNIGVFFTKGNPSKLLVRAGESAIASTAGYILYCVTLQYTKTTDSVETTTRKSYSLDETLTGDTWIDGKPIYRRVITSTVPNTGGFSVPFEAEQESIIRFEGFIQYNNSNVPVNYFSSTTNYGTAYVAASTINCQVANSAYIDAPLKFIIEYTKSE